MLRTLIVKEIAATVFDLRFAVVTLLCVVLVPLGMYVSRKDYEGRLAGYQREHAEYRQRHGEGVDWDVRNVVAEGFRPPSPLSILASGVDSVMPDKALTSYSGLISTVKEPCVNNPHALLFGKADFLFNMTFVVSMAALVLSFSAISGERETATLRLMIANSVPRHRVLLSKLVGISTALLMPLLLSVLVALLVLDASPVIAIASPQIWPALLLILGATGLFLLGMVGLGLLVSTLTYTAMNAMVLAFLIWAGLVLGIPKVSPMFADILHPVQRASTFDFTKRLIAEDIDRELIEEREALRKKCFDEFGAPESDMRTNAPDSDEGKKAKAEFERLFAPIAEQYKKRLAEELRRVERDYRRRTSVRSAIAMNLSRISPVCSYTYVVCGLAGTGAAEPDNFIRNAQRFQDDVKQNIYTKVIISRRRHGASFRAVEGFDARTAHLPDMTYAYPPLTTALQNVWPDILLLGLFDVLFFSLAFLRFNKYDVR